jgi:4-hydroxy-tetrahydrodipicolinate synthase
MSQNAQSFRGTGIALITPFQKDFSVDWNALEKCIEHLIAGSVEYIVSLGTTGESATLNSDEKKQVVAFTREKINGRIPLVVGVGGNHTEAILNQISEMDWDGVSGILSVSPYYNKPTQEGIYRHYMSINEAVDRSCKLPIILYNVPGRTSSNISSETTLRLARNAEHVKAVKEASGDLVQIGRIIRDKLEGFEVLSGDDPLCLPQLGLGMDGIISVIGNAFPKEFSDMVRAGLIGDFNTARKIHFQLLELIELIFEQGNPGGVKAAMEVLELCEDHLRLPLYPVDTNLYGRIKEKVLEIKS